MFHEEPVPRAARTFLAEHGFDVNLLPPWSSLELEGVSPVTVGSAKVITINPPTGVRTAGMDPRREAYATAV